MLTIGSSVTLKVFSGESQGFRRFSITDSEVAVVTEESSNLASVMAVVDALVFAFCERLAAALAYWDIQERMHLFLGQAVSVGPIQDVLAVCGLVFFDGGPLALLAVVMQPVALGAVAMKLTAVLGLAATRAPLVCVCSHALPTGPPMG